MSKTLVDNSWSMAQHELIVRAQSLHSACLAFTGPARTYIWRGSNHTDNAAVQSLSEEIAGSVCSTPVATWGLLARPRFLRGHCLRSAAVAPALRRAAAVHQLVPQASADLPKRNALPHPQMAFPTALGALTVLHPHPQVNRALSTTSDVADQPEKCFHTPLQKH